MGRGQVSWQRDNGGELMSAALSDGNISEKIRAKIERVSMLTREGGKIPIRPELRRSIAIYENGFVVIAQGESTTENVRGVLRAARKSGFPLTEKVELRPEQILSLYEEADQTEEESENQEFQVRRQKEAKEIIMAAVSRKASDIHIIAGKQGHSNIWFRSYGRRMRYRTMSNVDAMMMIEAIFAVARDVVGESSLNLRQGALDSESGLLPRNIQMVRLQFTPQNNRRGALIMRLIPFSSAADNDISKLGYSRRHLEDFAKMRKRTNGMYILAGKVSSGKTTTLQRTLNTMYLEKNREILIFTIEDPVELELEDAIQMVAKAQPDPHKKGETIDGFEAGISSLLRSDANVGVLGEIRLASTAKRAVEAVMTGHALWTTVHTGSALRILGRLLDLGVEPYKLSDPDIVAGLIYQRLVGTICPVCRIRMDHGLHLGMVKKQLVVDTVHVTDRPASKLYLRGNGFIPDPTQSPSNWKACTGNCMSGLNGRTVVAEVVLPDERLLADFARTKDQVAARTYWATPEAEGGLGGKPTIHHALTKVGAGLIDINEVEEEVNFVSSYIREYPHLIPTLHADVAEMITAIEAKAAEEDE